MTIPAQGEVELLLFLTAFQPASGPTAAQLFASLWLLPADPGGHSVRSEGDTSFNYHVRNRLQRRFCSLKQTRCATAVSLSWKASV